MAPGAPLSASSSSSSTLSVRRNESGRRSNRSLINTTMYDDEWITKYREIRPERSLAIRFMAYATGSPRDATIIKKKTPRLYLEPPERTNELAEHASRLYWITVDGARRRESGNQPSSRGSSVLPSPTYRTRRDGHFEPASGGAHDEADAYSPGAPDDDPVVGYQHGGTRQRPPGTGAPHPAGLVPPQRPHGAA